MDVSDIVEKAHIGGGIALNSLLIYVIRTHTKLKLGAYKHLLTIFASFDLFLTILHGFVEPTVVIVEHTFGVVSQGPVQNRKLTAAYCTAFTIPFTLMNIHFLYRYWAVQRPQLVHFFSRPFFITVLVSIPLAECVGWWLMCFFLSDGDDNGVGTEVVRAAYEGEYGRRIECGWLVMDHWARRNGHQDARFTFNLIFFDCVMILLFSTALTLGALTYTGLRDATRISATARLLQLKLLIAVTAQTIVPLICVYIPYFVVLNFPFFGIPSGPMAGMCMLMTACFPAWDAVIIILLMTDYREAVLSMTVRRCAKTSSSRVGDVPSVAGVAINVMLLYLIRKHSRQNLGAYKQLLTVFTCFDLFLILLHLVNDPKIVVSGRIFGAITNSFAKNKQITSFHYTCFTVPFFLLNIHFLYRYWTVRHSHLIHLFSRPAFVLLLVTITLTFCGLWHLLSVYGPLDKGVAVDVVRTVYEHKYGTRIDHGWCVMDFADKANGARFAVILCLFDALMVVSFSTALTLGVLTYTSIRDAATISVRYRALQLKLLIAVTAQTLVPLVFVYIPYFCSVTLPYFGLPAGGIGSVCMLMTACFPVSLIDQTENPNYSTSPQATSPATTPSSILCS